MEKRFQSLDEFINESKEINEANKAEQLVAAWLGMDPENAGDEEYDIEDFVDGNKSNAKKIWSAFDKLTKGMDKNELGEYSAALEILVKESEELNEREISIGPNGKGQDDEGNFVMKKGNNIVDADGTFVCKANAKHVIYVSDNIFEASLTASYVQGAPVAINDIPGTISNINLQLGELVLEFDFEDAEGNTHTAINIGDKFILKAGNPKTTMDADGSISTTL